MSLRDEAVRIGKDLGWVCVPLYLREGKWIPPYPYREFRGTTFDVELWERLWHGQDDAPGIGAIWPDDVIEVEADSDDATEWLRRRDLPRTPTFESRRGPHYLFRANGGGVNREPHPKVEVLCADGKALLVLPPTPPKRWKPSLGLGEVSFAPLPDAFKGAKTNGHKDRVKIELAPIPEGNRNEQMAKVVGKFVAKLAPSEALAASLAYDVFNCKPPLGTETITEMVQRFVSQDAPPAAEPRKVSSTGVTLDDVHAVFRRGLHLPDVTVLDVVIAQVLANLRDADPVFLMVVGAASRGKTEAVDSIRLVPEVYALSELSPATLLSGFRDPKHRGKDHSLLTRLSAEGRRVMMLKDFGTVTSMHREARAQVLAQLREVFDGSLVKPTGMGVELSWEGFMGFVAGATPAIDDLHGVLSILGDRFVYFRVPDVDRNHATTTALDHREDARKLREDRRRIVAELIAGIDPGPAPTLTGTARTLLVEVSDFATRARTAVSRDSHSREVVAFPELEAPMRLAKQLAAVSDGLQALGYTEARALEVVAKMALDSVPPIRVRCLDALRTDIRLRTSQIAERTGLPTSTARRALEDLALVGIVVREKGGSDERAPDWWELMIPVPGTSEG